MQAYQPAPCVYCGASWNPPGAQTCVKCHNLLPGAAPQYSQVVASPAAGSATAGDRGFYRGTARTFVFTLVATNGYFVWWSFQLLSLARRERFPKAGSPWWILFPFMNLVYLSRAFKGLSE